MKLSERLSNSPYFFKGSHSLFFDWFLKLVFSKKVNKGEFIIEEIETEFGLNTIGKTRIKGYKV